MGSSTLPPAGIHRAGALRGSIPVVLGAVPGVLWGSAGSLELLNIFPQPCALDMHAAKAEPETGEPVPAPHQGTGPGTHTTTHGPPKPPKTPQPTQNPPKIHPRPPKDTPLGVSEGFGKVLVSFWRVWEGLGTRGFQYKDTAPKGVEA